MKFVGFQVKNDLASLAGLPHPIHEGVKVLKEVKKTFGKVESCHEIVLLSRG